MKIVIVEPQKEPYIADVENTLESYQKIVGGWIETVHLTKNFILVCNEEGKLLGLPDNRDLGWDVIAGNFFITGDGGEDFRDLTEEECKRVLKAFRL